jgi:hypothetical protein
VTLTNCDAVKRLKPRLIPSLGANEIRKLSIPCVCCESARRLLCVYISGGAARDVVCAK